MNAADPGREAASDCDEVLDRLQLFLDEECPSDVEDAVRAHIADCPPWFDRADFEVKLREIVAQRCKDAAPSGLLDRVVAQIRDAEPRN